MMVKISTGIRNGLMASGSLKSLLDGSVIKIYSGTPPASANDAVPNSAALLAVYSKGGTGDTITFSGTVENGILSKNPSEVWRANGLVTGVATWYRLVQPSDDGTSSTTLRRVQGTIATVGADMLFSNTTVVAGQQLPVLDSAQFVMPSTEG